MKHSTQPRPVGDMVGRRASPNVLHSLGEALVPDFSAITLATIQRQIGLITSDQLNAGGIHRTARQRLVDQKVLERPYKSVYMVTTRRPTFEQRLLALSLAHPSGFITGPTAGGYLGLRRMPRSSKIHLCLPHPIHISEPTGVLLRQSTRIGPLDVRVLDNGMRIASFARLLFDLAADLTKTNLTSVMDQVLRAGDSSWEELGAISVRLPQGQIGRRRKNCAGAQRHHREPRRTA